MGSPVNHCDHGHETRGEIRRLPISGRGMNQSAVLVCYTHFREEIAYRNERARQTGRDKWEFPEWTDLEVDQPRAE